MFFKISQISQENTCVGVFFRNLVKKRLQHRCFLVKLAKFLRPPFFTEHFRWLLLFFSIYKFFFFHGTEAVTQRCSVKKAFLEISQNSQENTCARVSVLNFIKKETLAREFSVNFAKFLRAPFLKEHLRWLLLMGLKSILT